MGTEKESPQDLPRPAKAPGGSSAKKTTPKQGKKTSGTPNKNISRDPDSRKTGTKQSGSSGKPQGKKKPAAQGTRQGGGSGKPQSKTAVAKPNKKRPEIKKAQRKKVNRYVRIIGRIAFMIQALISLIMVISIARTKMLPWKYVLLIMAGLGVLLLITLIMNLRRNRRVRLVGTGISVVVIALTFVFTTYFNRTMGVIAGNSKALKTDNMIVVVRADDPAQVLVDAKDYTYAVHLPAGASGGSSAMIVDIEDALSSKIKVEEYSSDIEAAKALMEGKVNAAIYNKAYTEVIAEALDNDDYENQVRVLHQYGIETDIEKETVDVGKPFNVLISGIDVYGDISQTSRSDVNIIVTVNPKTKKVLLTSTPRDYYVKIPEISGDSRDKLTHAGIYGVDASMRTLEELYGIDITYFVRVNFDTLIKLVDAMDGLDVYVEYPFDAYTDEYHFDKGWHDMFGDQVLAFCRERYSFADGDNQRGRNQEQVLKALIEKLLSPAILPHYADILDSLDGFFQLNMSQEKIAELVNMQLTDNAHWEILKQAAEQGDSALESTYSGGSTPLYVMWPDYASVYVNAARIETILKEGYTD